MTSDLHLNGNTKKQLHCRRGDAVSLGILYFVIYFVFQPPYTMAYNYFWQLFRSLLTLLLLLILSPGGDSVVSRRQGCQIDKYRTLLILYLS
jgi:hypothetical protein